MPAKAVRMSNWWSSEVVAHSVERCHRSLAQIPWFLNEAETALIYNNSGQAPRMVGLRRDREMAFDPEAPKAMLAALGVSR